MLLVALLAGLGAGTYHWFYGDRTFRGYGHDGRLLKQFEMSDEMFMTECVLFSLAVTTVCIVVWLLIGLFRGLAVRRPG